MIIVLCIFLFLWGCSQCCTADEYERSEYGKERRHREMLEQRERLAEEKSRRKKRVTRTYARDERGRFVAQEVIEEV